MTLPPLAYEDESFLSGPDGRPIRMLAEYLAPLHALRAAGIADTVVFFGSARLSPTGHLGRYYEEARQLAAEVTRWAHTVAPDRSRLVVCSGGSGYRRRSVSQRISNGDAAACGPATVGAKIGAGGGGGPSLSGSRLPGARPYIARAICSSLVDRFVGEHEPGPPPMIDG